MNDFDHNLIELYLEGNLPADKWEEFSHRLEQSADMRREFRKLSVLDENLRAQSIGFPNLAEREQNKTLPAYLPWLVAAASLTLAFIFWSKEQQSLHASKSETDHGITINSKNFPKIKLIDFFGLDESHHLFIAGETQFEVGEYKTSSGKLHLRFGESVDVIFTGASIFEILSEKEIFVHKGNIRTIVHDARGHEFTIRTPNANYIDWGTEFCLNIRPNTKDQFEVDEGLVEVTDRKKVHSFGKFKPYKNPNLRNAPFTFVDITNDLPGEAGYARWIDQIAAKSKDPNLLGLYTFGSHNTNNVNPSSKNFFHNLPKINPADFETNNPKNVFSNRAKSGIASDFIQRNCSRSYGRWRGSGSKSVKFRNRWSAAYFELPGKYEEFSFQAWLQMYESKSYSNMLFKPLLWDGSGKMCIHTNRRGTINQSMWGEENLRERRISNHKIVNDWQLLTYTFGKENGRVVSKLYLDKNLICTAYPEYTKHIQMDGLLLGTSRNGQIGKIVSNFDGRMDEISLWSKAFSEQEIKQEYHLGYPFYQSFSSELVQK
jgi:hypothetical protein